MTTKRQAFLVNLEQTFHQLLDKYFIEIGQSERVDKAMGVNAAKAHELLSKISIAMPEPVIEMASNQPNSIQREVAESLVLFLAQESMHSTEFDSSFGQHVQYLIEEIIVEHKEQLGGYLAR